MKRPPSPNTTGSPGPRRPELTPKDFLEIAAELQARRCAQIGRLSAAGRLRRWGQ